jgi:hypothetical protein
MMNDLKFSNATRMRLSISLKNIRNSKRASNTNVLMTKNPTLNN